MQRPDLFEHFVDLHLVRHREGLLMRDLSVMQFDGTIGESCHDRIVRHHHNRSSLLMEISQLLENDFLVLGIEVSGRLIGQNDAGIVDQRAGNADSLLLAAGELCW